MGGRQTLANLPILLDAITGGGKPSVVKVAKFIEVCGADSKQNMGRFLPGCAFGGLRNAMPFI
jgi:hypothetical protein